jgi:hypothetical protein
MDALLSTQPEDPFIAQPAVVFLVLLVQEVGHVYIDQPVPPGTFYPDIAYVSARYLYSVG